MFALHPQLAKDCEVIGDLPLCRVLLMNNRHFPWLILVPKREGMRELYDLNEADYHDALTEVRHVAQQLNTITNAHKINIACLGNMVEQLHIHIIARYPNDAAWPKPVWGQSAEPYDAAALQRQVEIFRPILSA